MEQIVKTKYFALLRFQVQWFPDKIGIQGFKVQACPPRPETGTGSGGATSLANIAISILTTQVQSSGFTVQWLFAEPLTVKCGFFMSRLRTLGMDNCSWLQVEPLNCEP